MPIAKKKKPPAKKKAVKKPIKSNRKTKGKRMQTALDAKAIRRLTKFEPYIRSIVTEQVNTLAPRRIEIVSNDEVKLLPDTATHEMFDTILKAVMCGPVCLVGPAGSGKTTLAGQVAAALGLKLYFTGAIASEYKLMGFIDANGRLNRTAFREAYEHGGLFLFDEIDASLPQAILAFNNALANGFCDFPDANIPRHKDFKVMAAANTYGHGADRVYVGRNQLDAASLDRFIFITMGYDEKLETALVQNLDWCEHVQVARAAVTALKLRYIVSPRATIYGASLLEKGLDFEIVNMLAIFKGMPPEDMRMVKTKMKEIMVKGVKEKPRTFI